MPIHFDITVVAASVLLLLNIWGFILVGRDKSKARRKRWRTPEKVFFYVALLGGSPGIYFGLFVFRHKTKHKSFVYGIPLIFVLQSIGVYLVYREWM